MTLNPKDIRTLPLALAGEGDPVRVVAIDGGQATQRRLRDLGIVAGREITVVNRQGPGGVIVALEDLRLALGFGMARKVRVAPAAGSGTR